MGDRPKLLEDISVITASDKLKGKLIVYVVNVIDVIPEDGKTCDPMVEVTFNKKDQKTDKKMNTLNAEFKQKLVFDVDFDSLEFVPLAEIDVKDWDRIKNDQIGHVTVDFKPCFQNPSRPFLRRHLCLQRGSKARRASKFNRKVS